MEMLLDFIIPERYIQVICRRLMSKVDDLLLILLMNTTAFFYIFPVLVRSCRCSAD